MTISGCDGELIAKKHKELTVDVNVVYLDFDGIFRERYKILKNHRKVYIK